MSTTSTGGSPDSIYPPRPVTGQNEGHVQPPMPGEKPAPPAPSTSQPATAPATAPSKQVNPIKDFIAGGVGGVACVLVGQPFDTTKVRLQTAQPGQYSGALDVVKKTVTREGPTGLFRGMLSPILGVSPMFAVSFWGYASGKKLVYAMSPDRQSMDLSYPELAFAGAFSALPQTAITCPVERVKVILQSQGEQRLYSGPADVVKKLYAEGGVAALYRGTFATLFRDMPGSAAYFISYEALKKKLTPEGTPASTVSILTAGGLAGIAMWSIAIPADTIKSRVQSAPKGTYKGIVDCATQLMAKDGPKALFRGFSAAMARAFPANAATFLAYEAALKVMG